MLREQNLPRLQSERPVPQPLQHETQPHPDMQIFQSVLAQIERKE